MHAVNQTFVFYRVSGEEGWQQLLGEPSLNLPLFCKAQQNPGFETERGAEFIQQPLPCCEHAQSVSSGRARSGLKGKKKTKMEQTQKPK